MCEPIEQGAGQALQAEDFGPLLEWRKRVVRPC